MDYNTRAAEAINAENQVGSVQKAYGKGGELVIRLWDTFPDNTEEPLWVEIDSLAVPLFISSFESHGNTKAAVTFDDFDTEEKAAMLIGKKLYSENPQIDCDDDEWGFLKGYKFHDLTSGKEGVVTDLVSNELNPLIEVTIGGQEHLLPIADALVENLNKKKKTVEMRLAEGIFEL